MREREGGSEGGSEKERERKKERGSEKERGIRTNVPVNFDAVPKTAKMEFLIKEVVPFNTPLLIEPR